MSTPFNYSVNVDTLNGAVAINKLTRDFINLELSEVLESLNVKDGVITFRFQDPMNDQAATDVALDNLISNHDGIPIIPPKICSLLGEDHQDDSYLDINYTIVPKPNLHPKRTFVQGELQKVEWHSSMAFNDLVLKVEAVYARNSFGFADTRTVTRTWYDESGEALPDVKVTTKSYLANPMDQIKEGTRRRGNIVDGIQLPVLAFMIETMTVAPWNKTMNEILLIGREFLDTHENDFNKFIHNSSSITDPLDVLNFGKKTVVVAFEAAANTTSTWLKNTPLQLHPGGLVTIEQYLISEFSI